MKVLLTGASGFIGQHIRQALVSYSEYELITPSHHEADYTTTQTVKQWLPLLNGVDIVINSVGIISETRKTKHKAHQSFLNLHSKAPIALFQACVQSQVKRVIQISALGADDHAFTPYQKSKLAADNVLRKLPLSSFILRPSLVYGQRGTSLAMFKWLASLPVMVLPDGGNQLIQPVHVSDLVAVVKYCLRANFDAEIICQTIDVVGPSAISLADYLLAIRESLQKASKIKTQSDPLIIPIPARYVLFAAQLARYLIPILHPDNLRMLQQGNIADVKRLTDVLGRSPLAVNKGLKLLENPNDVFTH